MCDCILLDLESNSRPKEFTLGFMYNVWKKMKWHKHGIMFLSNLNGPTQYITHPSVRNWYLSLEVRSTKGCLDPKFLAPRLNAYPHNPTFMNINTSRTFMGGFRLGFGSKKLGAQNTPCNLHACVRTSDWTHVWKSISPTEKKIISQTKAAKICHENDAMSTPPQSFMLWTRNPSIDLLDPNFLLSTNRITRSWRFFGLGP